MRNCRPRVESPATLSESSRSGYFARRRAGFIACVKALAVIPSSVRIGSRSMGPRALSRTATASCLVGFLPSLHKPRPRTAGGLIRVSRPSQSPSPPLPGSLIAGRPWPLREARVYGFYSPAFVYNEARPLLLGSRARCGRNLWIERRFKTRGYCTPLPHGENALHCCALWDNRNAR